VWCVCVFDVDCDSSFGFNGRPKSQCVRWLPLSPVGVVVWLFRLLCSL